MATSRVTAVAMAGDNVTFTAPFSFAVAPLVVLFFPSSKVFISCNASGYILRIRTSYYRHLLPLPNPTMLFPGAILCTYISTPKKNPPTHLVHPISLLLSSSLAVTGIPLCLSFSVSGEINSKQR